MKKYIIASLLLLLVVIPAFALAQADIDPNGQTSACVSLSNNLRYRSRDINTNGEVSTLQDFLQSKNYLNSEPTGYFGLLTVKVVKDFQSANGISPTGYVGPVTRAKISVLTCGNVTNPPNPLTGACVYGDLYNRLTGVRCGTGEGTNTDDNFYINPSSASIKVGGTATFQAMYNNCPKGAQCFVGPLPVQASWNSSNPSVASVSVINDNSYRTATVTGVSQGITTITATYTNGSGNVLTASALVTVTGSGNYSSITVLSPNGGETWMKGTMQTIIWQDNSTTPPCPAGTGCYKPAPKYFDITLEPYYAPCVSRICPMFAYRAPYTIANSVPSSSYNWSVGKVINSNADLASDGKYVIEVCQTGTSVCDSSNNYFTIVTGETYTPNTY